MTTTIGASRPDHIAELTRGAHLPLDPVRSEHLSVILETITCAWQELQAGGAVALLTGEEAEVNALLDPRLNHYCRSQPLWKDLVHSVQRGRESMSYDGSKLEKRPDLSFVFLHGNRNFPMVVECKIIDHPNNKNVSDYCKNGIARFVCGDYAWASREAVMLAYVRDGTTVPSKLAPHLANKAKLVPDPFQTTSHPATRTDLHPTVRHSEHQRSFNYPSVVNGNAPGPISLFHLWL
jgi:hypothetical protein